jgi:hypothetical protein
MIAIAITPCPTVHVGRCPAVDCARGLSASPSTVYCLHDCDGVHLGTIPLPVAWPATGPSAPTLYLRRDVIRPSTWHPARAFGTSGTR